MRPRDALGLVMVAALGLAACSKGCGEDLPDPDVCSGPRAGSVETAALGAADEVGFTPYQGGDVVRLIFTDDGEATLPIEFRLTGSDVPACVDHRTELFGCPAGEACADGLTSHVVLNAPLHTYPIGDDEEGPERETQTLYLRLERDNEPPDGARLELVSQIAGIDVSVQLWLEEPGPDATPAAAAP
jgi:hypothetical protein